MMRTPALPVLIITAVLVWAMATTIDWRGPPELPTPPTSTSTTTPGSTTTTSMPLAGETTTTAAGTTTFTTFTTSTTASTTSPGTTSTTTTAPRVFTFSVEAETFLIVETNKLRASLGLPQLEVNAELSDYARVWAMHMAMTGTVVHSDIRTLLDPWGIVGENVGQGADIEELWSGFNGSPLHYENLIELSFTATGAGVVIDPDGRLWVTHVFAGLEILPVTTIVPPIIELPVPPWVPSVPRPIHPIHPLPSTPPPHPVDPVHPLGNI